MNAFAGDIIQSANNYEVGGINNVSTDVLHEKMGDEWGEAETTEVAHVVIGWATNLLSPECGNSITSETAIRQPVEQVTSATKSTEDTTQQRWICQSTQNHTLNKNCTETATETAVQNDSEKWEEFDMEDWYGKNPGMYRTKKSITQTENEARGGRNILIQRKTK